MFSILDLVLVAKFGFNAHIPWWLWVWSILNEVAFGVYQKRISDAATVIIKRL